MSTTKKRPKFIVTAQVVIPRGAFGESGGFGGGWGCRDPQGAGRRVWGRDPLWPPLSDPHRVLQVWQGRQR